MKASLKGPTLALALALVAMGAMPACAERDEVRYRPDDNRAWSNGRGHDVRRHPIYRQSYQHPYRYSQPVYAPRSYYYRDDRPAIRVRSPGIDLFFPLDIR